MTGFESESGAIQEPVYWVEKKKQPAEEGRQAALADQARERRGHTLLEEEAILDLTGLAGGSVFGGAGFADFFSGVSTDSADEALAA